MQKAQFPHLMSCSKPLSKPNSLPRNLPRSSSPPTSAATPSSTSPPEPNSLSLKLAHLIHRPTRSVLVTSIQRELVKTIVRKFRHTSPASREREREREMEPPRLLEQAMPIFREGIALTLSRWSALQMAIDNEWGGRNSRQRADELGHDIFTWYTQSTEPLYIDDLEDLLYEAMISLNTVAEDGSVEEVAEKLMVMHEECLEGNFTTIEKLREASLKRVGPTHIKQVVEGEDEEEDTDTENMTVDDSLYMMVDAPKSQSSPTAVDKAGDKGRPPQTDADGWTVVSSRKSRAKK